MKTLKTFSLTISAVLSVCLVVFAMSCGTWVGNPVKDEEPTTTAPKNMTAGLGEVFLQKVSLKAGASFNVKYTLAKSASLGLTETKGFNASSSESAFEVSVYDSAGSEVRYDRKSIDGVGTSFKPDADGDYYVGVKSNSTDKVDIQEAKIEAAESSDTATVSKDRAESAFKDVSLKAVVAFARKCVQNTADGSSTTTYNAPTGEYYAQPIVFLSKIDADKKATLISSATIKLVFKGKEIALKKLSDIDYDNFREYSSLTKDQHVVFTRTFYQGYFGAAGEMYTVDYFKKGKSGGCDTATTFALGTDVGTQKVELNIKDSSLGIDETLPVRASISPAISFYMGDGTKVSDWTQCSYNRATGKPTTYNGTATDCKEFSIKASPFIALDYKLPSETGEGTKASDPTRVVFYGHSNTKAWYDKILADYAALAAGTQDTVTISSCLNNGGLVSVPMSSSKTVVPLSEFNVGVGDVINLARNTGSYTALLKFYQGNVDASGTFDYSTCLPDGSTSCPAFKTVKVKQESCTIKSDSGITVLGVSESFIYPDYFSISGIVKE